MCSKDVDITKPGEKALQKMKSESGVDLFKMPDTSRLIRARYRKKVMDEDSYLEEMGRIIQRDFFPDLEKLKAQNEFLDALSENDAEKLRQIYSKYSTGKRLATERDAFASPATFETPQEPIRQDDTLPMSSSNKQNTSYKDRRKEQSSNSEYDDKKIEEKEEESAKKYQSLDQYMTTHTSEDNESFNEIQQVSQSRHQLKYPWLYKDEKEYDISKRLEVPSIEEQAGDNKRELTVDTWNYKNKNYVMYVPEVTGVQLSCEEEVERSKRRQEIVHYNTRLSKNPFNEQHSKETIQELALTQAKTMEGKIGVDGKVVTCTNTPRVNGFSFVKTPSPAPGVNESPLMTWGEIEGTPFKLDGSDTPLPSSGIAPSFRIPETSRREKLALALADKASQVHRDKKRKAIEAAKFNLTSQTPRLSSLERFNEMSPAARKLASASLSKRLGTDIALRSSYSPSPRRTPQHETLLVVSHKSTPVNMTDNLLQLPKRPKAADFF